MNDHGTPGDRPRKAKPGRRERAAARESAGRRAERADETLDDVLLRLGIADDWDWLLFGDGSGSNYRRASGWATVSIERVTMDRQVWAGAMNRGTVNLAEMLAYIQPLTWIVNTEQARVKAGGNRRAVRVHIVTDSQYCVTQGQVTGGLVEANAGLWAAISAMRRDGVVVTWHHINREDVALNSFCDELSKIARRLIESYNWPEGAGGAGTQYDHNPD
jgi:ribonuclease HI